MPVKNRFYIAYEIFACAASAWFLIDAFLFPTRIGPGGSTCGAAFLILALFTYVRFPWFSGSFGFCNPLIFCFILLWGVEAVIPVFIAFALFFSIRRIRFRLLVSNVARYVLATGLTAFFYTSAGGVISFPAFSSRLIFPVAAAALLHLSLDFATFLFQAGGFGERLSLKEVAGGYAFELPFYFLVPFVPIGLHALPTSVFLFIPVSFFIVLGVFKFGFKAYVEKEKLQTIYEFAKKLAATLNFEELIPDLCRALEASLRASGCAIYLRDAEQRFRRIAASGVPGAGALPEFLAGERFPDFAGADVRVLKDPVEPFPPALFPMALVMLRAEEKVIGCLCLNRPRIAEEQEKFLSILGGQIASAASNSFLFHETVRAHESLKAMQAQLVQTSKLAAVGQLAAGVAHEINNPLGAILLNAVGLRDKPGDRESIEIIVESSRRCQAIVQNLLRFSREGAKKQAVKLDEAVAGALDLWGKQLELDGVRVETGFQESRAVLGIPQDLVSVIANLISNARDAVLAAGKADGVIRIQTRSQGNESLLEISDNGCGIPAGSLARIFEPFYTTKEVGKGTGLGLSVSYGIVRSMQGTMDVQSREGEGTTFTVRLPAAGTDPASGSQDSSVLDRALDML